MNLNCLLLCVAFLGPAPIENRSAGEGLKWEADLETAQREARSSGRLLLIHFGGPWCEPCRRLEKQVFSQPGFGHDLSARYVAVKVDPREHEDLAKQFGIRAVPTDVVTTASGQLVTRMESPTSVAAYSDALNRLAVNVQPSADIAATGVASTTTAQQAAPQDPLDRYASYYSRRPAVPPAVQSTEQSASTTAEASRPTARQSSGAHTAMAQSKPADQPSHPPLPNLSPKNPPVVLDGYCAVTLVTKRQWQPGSEQWGAIHRGRTYLFASEAAQRAFLADPDRYSPVLSGNDPVMRVEHNQMVAGKREHGAFYNDRIYLFTSEDTFQQFDRDPSRYTVETSRQARLR